MPSENWSEEDLIRRVTALLRHAESTDIEAEANAFFEKAHELMTRHAIDMARIRTEERKRTGGVAEEPMVEDYMFSSYAHHATAKQTLLEMVCKHHSVRFFSYPNRKDSNLDKLGNRGLHESQWAMLIGYRDDIEAVKLLFVNLLIQSQRFAAEDWRRRYGNDKHSSWEDGHVGKFTWLSGHMEGFAERIGARFKELTENIYASVVDGRALILDKDANVLEWMYDHGYARRPPPPFVACGELEETDLWKPGTCAFSKGHNGDHYFQHSWCWEVEPLDQLNGRKIQRYCKKNLGHVDPHEYTYRPTSSGSSSAYVRKGRAVSYEGKSAGRDAANRADIGLSRTGSGSSPRLGGR